jgi:tetratricopeptide (TPR) repeat protein
VKPGKRKLTLDDAAAALDKDDKQTIIDILLGWARSDVALQERLLQYAARRTSPETAVAAAKQAFSDAVTIRGFLHYQHAHDWARAVDAAIDNIEQLLRDGHATAAIDLCEWALGRLERAVERMDDSDGHFRPLQQRLEAVHLEACGQAKPDPVALAKRLYDHELKSEWDMFDEAALRYAEVLGEQGLAAYREFAEGAWAQVPQRGPDDPFDIGHRRIARMMEALAKTTGDVEQFVDVLRRDLSGAHSYYRIAEAYKEAGRYDQALMWGKRGLELFPVGRDDGLRELVADEYHRRGEHDAAMELAWNAFDRSPNIRTYIVLERHAQRAGNWPVWRDRALTEIRLRLHDGSQSDRSLLVEICMHDGDVEAAWAEAQRGVCSGYLLLQMAELREANHPGDSGPIFLAHAEELLERVRDSRYETAVTMLARAATAMGRAGLGPAFVHRLDELCRRYRAKRNFIRLVAENESALRGT